MLCIYQKIPKECLYGSNFTPWSARGKYVVHVIEVLRSSEKPFSFRILQDYIFQMFGIINVKRFMIKCR